MFHFSCSKALALTLLLVVSALVLTALVRKPDCMQAAGLDVWNVNRLEDRLGEERSREREMESKEQRMWQRIAERRLITTRLLERQLTLSEAVDELLALSEKHPEWFETSRKVVAFYLELEASSEREFAAHMLLHWIRGAREDALFVGEPARAATIRERLLELGIETKSECGATIWRPFPGLISPSAAPEK